MTEHDLLEVIDMEETCGLSRWGWEGYYQELERDNTIMLVAESISTDYLTSYKLNGFVAARITAGELHINNIAVRPHARRGGVASELLSRALHAAIERGTDTAVLEVRAANTTAQQLYRRHGFRVVGRRHNYYKEPPDDALLMTADLKTIT